MKRWTEKAINFVVEERLKGVPSNIIARRVGRSKNEVNCCFNNYLMRVMVLPWDLVKRVVRLPNYLGVKITHQ